MINSNVLEVAIGLVFCYASVALMSSSIFEALSNWFNLRAHNLLKGISQLLNAEDDSSGKELLMAVYNHGLVHPLGDGIASEIKAIKNRPDFIAAGDFAVAIMRKLENKMTVAEDGKVSLDTRALGDSRLAHLVNHYLDKAAGDIQQLQTELAGWFDQGMEQVSAAYRRRSQLWCFTIALVITAIFNIDSVQLFKTLWLQPQLAAQLNVAGEESATQALLQLQALPIGWQPGSLDSLISTGFVGWLVTASAALFGAPFWFDVLKNLTRLRAGAAKPAVAKAAKSN